MAAVLMMMVAGSGYAADATLAVDMNSAYVWRGITFNEGMVAQPSLDVSNGGFNINVWGNYDIDDYDETLETDEFSEIDLTVSYGKSFGVVDLSAGVIGYQFPNGGEGTTELYLSGAVNLPAGFSVGLDAYYDVDEVDDYYFSACIGFAADINDALGVELSAAAGYAGEDMSAGEEDGFHDCTVSAGASYSITKAIGVSAHITWVDSLDEDVLPEQDVDLFGGVSLSYSF